MSRLNPLLLACLLLVGPGSVLADNYQARKQELEQLRQDIARIEQRLEKSREQRSAVSRQIQALEQAIGESARRLRELGAERERNTKRIRELELERDDRQSAVDGQKQYLAREVRRAYMQGRQQYLKLLLNHEDPATLDRMLVYLDYMGRARHRRIHSALEDLQALAQVRQILDREMVRLEQLEREQTRQTEQLQSQRDERGTLLARLDTDIDTERSRLDALVEDEKALEGLLTDLRDALADLPEREMDRMTFAEQRGQLAWPLEGRLAARYGSRRGRASDGRWRGILLEAEQGTPVKAISHGQVVFANWLRGLGLLLIIDHGDGYMSLYGHSDSLYKDVGDWVSAGEVIAGVGDTGGPDRAGLYFELRVDGQPQNPLNWLRDDLRQDA